jgi:hypothetical protein
MIRSIFYLKQTIIFDIKQILISKIMIYPKYVDLFKLNWDTLE